MIATILNRVAPGAALAAALVTTALVATALVARADDIMPKTPADARKLEAADALPLTAFYDTPANLAQTKPGTLLRKEAVAAYVLPKGARGYRILYTSRDADGHAVAASAAVLIPAGKPPAGGWPVIAWAHGTSGVARVCAPSAMKDVFYGDEGLMPMVAAGFAVVAPDYHGLGTEVPHQYLNAAAQAHDVIDAIPAARAAYPALGARWVADGHSEGGRAAWAVGEQETALKDATYLGAVSVAGAINLDSLLGNASGTKGAGFYMPFIVFGVKSRFPALAPADILNAKGLAHYDAVTTKGCWLYSYASYGGGDIAALVKPNWLQNAYVARFIAEDSIGKMPIAGPVFAIAGEADQTVPLAAVRTTVARACKMGMTVTFKSYPGLDHDPTMTGSTPDQLQWIRDRFAGKPAKGTCVRS
jgi:hypothetical protein